MGREEAGRGAGEVCVQEPPVSSLLTYFLPRWLVPLELTGIIIEVRDGKGICRPSEVVPCECRLLVDGLRVKQCMVLQHGAS